VPVIVIVRFGMRSNAIADVMGVVTGADLDARPSSRRT
jgi:hypothetical protein